MKLDRTLIDAIQDKPYRLKIKNNHIKPNGKSRTNFLTCYMVDDALQMHVDNGHTPTGEDIKAGIRLTQDDMGRLVEFVQRNIR